MCHVMNARAPVCPVGSRVEGVAMAHLTAGSLAAYAREQVAHGKRLIATHAPDRTGCCRRCGRKAPCDGAVHGQLLVDHFGRHARTASIALPQP
jgi:hypothetical protein